MGEHEEALRIGGIVVGIVVVLAVDLSWLGLLLLALLVGGFELVAWRIGEVAPSRDELRAGGAVEGS